MFRMGAVAVDKGAIGVGVLKRRRQGRDRMSADAVSHWLGSVVGQSSPQYDDAFRENFRTIEDIVDVAQDIGIAAILDQCGVSSLSDKSRSMAEDGRVRGLAHNDLARIQDISIWPLLMAWPAGTVLGLSVAFF